MGRNDGDREMRIMVMVMSTLLSISALAESPWLLDNCRRADGRALIIPEPQQVTVKPGKFALPKRVTVELPESEGLICRQLEECLAPWGIAVERENELKAGAPATIRIVGGNPWGNPPENREGYHLVVDEAGVRIWSWNEAGLYYGAQTLQFMLRNAPRPELEFCDIVDYPDTPYRSYTMSIVNVKSQELEGLKRILDVMSRLKMNMLCLTIAESFPYEKLVFAKRKNSISREALEDLRDFCRERHIEIVPALQVLSHNSWLTTHADWDKMSEGTPSRNWDSEPCIQNEQARAITAQALREQIAFFKPKIFYVSLDEIYLGPFRQCPRCKDVPTMELVSDYMSFLRNAEGIGDTGVRLMFSHDSFISKPQWPEGDRLREALLDPATDLIGFWSYRENINDEPLRKFRGFETMGTCLAGKPNNVGNMIEAIKRNGGKGIRMTHWYFSSGGAFANLNWETPESTGGFVNGCDIIWHNRQEHHGRLPYDGTFEMMRLLGVARPGDYKNRRGTAAPFPLGDVCNAELTEAKGFPKLDERMVREAATLLRSRPEHFSLLTAPGGRWFGLRLSGTRGEAGGRSGIAIPMGNAVAGRWSLLMTSTRPLHIMDYLCINYGKERFKHNEAAGLSFHYADGSEAEVPLRYRYDFNDWNSPAGGFNEQVVLRGVDGNGDFYSFGVCDVINPHPEKPIAELVFHSMFLDGISPVLLALSAWNANAEWQEKPFEPAKMRKPFEVTAGAGNRIRVDFEDGQVSPVYMTQNGDFQGDIKLEVVSVPGRGKVLRAQVPPGVPNETNPYVRVSLDLPYTVDDVSKGLVRDCRLSHLRGFHHCVEYLSTRDPSLAQAGSFPYWAKRSYASTDWLHSNVNFAGKPMECNLDDLKKAKSRRMSFFFTRLDEPVEIYLDNIGDALTEWEYAPTWSPVSERDRHP